MPCTVQPKEDKSKGVLHVRYIYLAQAKMPRRCQQLDVMSYPINAQGHSTLTSKFIDKGKKDTAFIVELISVVLS